VNPELTAVNGGYIVAAATRGTIQFAGFCRLEAARPFFSSGRALGPAASVASILDLGIPST
jgi:hypothetical protein